MQLTKNSRGYYYVSFYAGRDNGRPKLVSKNTRCKERGDALAVVKKAKIEEIEYLAKADALHRDVVAKIFNGAGMRMEKMVDKWEKWQNEVNYSQATIFNRRQTLKQFIRYTKCAHKTPDQITVDNINAFINRPGKAKASSRMLGLEWLKGFFDWCQKNSFVSANVPRLIRGVNFTLLTHEQKERRNVQPLTEEEIARLIDKCNELRESFWKRAIIIGRATGLRLGDICVLEWAAINEDNLTVWTSKSEKRVEIEVPKLMKFFATLKRHDPVYVFPRQRTMYANADMRHMISNQFRRIADLCGIKKSFHSLRHARATEVYYWRGAQEVSRQLGHSSAQTSMGYVHPNPDNRSNNYDNKAENLMVRTEPPVGAGVSLGNAVSETT